MFLLYTLCAVPTMSGMRDFAQTQADAAGDDPAELFASGFNRATAAALTPVVAFHEQVCRTIQDGAMPKGKDTPVPANDSPSHRKAA